MKRILVSTLALALGSISVTAQSLDDLNVQIHGYATQGFLYTTNNNILTTSSSDGSAAWTEALLNITAQPTDKLHVGVQVRYFLLGNLGNAITLDWASADYRVNEKFGVRFGKVKTPVGLFNEIQDIDPSYMWSLLPQTVYPLESRNSMLSHLGGVVYGTVKLGPNGGALDYRASGGVLSLGPNDGYFVNEKESGIALTSGMSSPIVGGTLRWRTPVSGLMVGASDERLVHLTGGYYVNTPPGSAFGVHTGVPGTESIKAFDHYYLFSRYEGKKVMLAAEYDRVPLVCMFLMPLLPAPYTAVRLPEDHRSWYGMVSYKLTDKLSAGTYYTQEVDRQAALGPARYLKDLAISGRYDFGQYLYVKAEQHLMEGTANQLGLFDNELNPDGLQPTTRMTMLKIGVNF